MDSIAILRKYGIVDFGLADGIYVHCSLYVLDIGGEYVMYDCDYGTCKKGAAKNVLRDLADDLLCEIVDIEDKKRARGER